MYNKYQHTQKILFLLISMVISGLSFGQAVADNEIKKNITEISSPLQRLVQLKPKSFEYNTEKYRHLKLQHGKQYGFIAEDIRVVFPNLVKQKTVSYMFGKNSYRDTKINTIDEAGLIPVLVASIQQQQEQIEKLMAEVEILKNKKATASN